MNNELSPLRRIAPLILPIVLLPIGGAMLYFSFVYYESESNQVVREVEDDLRDRVQSWEDDLANTLTHWADAATNEYSARSYQEQLRETAPWFDSLYLWTPAQRVTKQSRSIAINGRRLFPTDPLRERDEAIRRIPCLQRARLFAARPETTVDDTVEAWRTWCLTEDGSVRMLALSEAVNALRRAGRWEDVLQVLDDDGLPHRLTLSDAVALNVPPFRAAVLALQRAEALHNLGRDDEASQLYFRTGMEITELDAPDAEVLFHLLSYPVLPRVEAHGNAQLTRTLQARAERLFRRVNGFREVRDQLLPRRVPLDPEAPRFVRDQYGDTPFLLFTHWTPTNYGVALQLDEAELLKDFLAHMGRYRRFLVITDASGEDRVAGAAMGDLAFTVPFSRTLTHLRIGMRAEPIEAQVLRVRLTAQLGTLFIITLIGALIVMIWGMRRVNQTQRLLLQRQKEFATRVTHELKTPLAGIKVMAENLELGHYADDRDRATMARSIVREADNLTQRVNEILSVTRERKLRQPEPFDPEEPLFEAIDQWGPRLEVAGVGFEADLQPTDEVLGDSEAIRDAVACLLDNALKYRREDVDARVWLSSEQRGNRVVLSVTDNGLGVPPPMRAAIFDRFVRVEGDNRGKAGGHGLGLAQVAQIAEAHGGTVRCVDGIDGGARFEIELPVLPG